MSTSNTNSKNDSKITPTTNPFKNVTSNAPNPSTSVFTFFLITLFYFVAKYKTPNSMSTMLTIIYIIAIVSTQISIKTAFCATLAFREQGWLMI